LPFLANPLITGSRKEAAKHSCGCHTLAASPDNPLITDREVEQKQLFIVSRCLPLFCDDAESSDHSALESKSEM
jgi:hypothetical protein